MNTRTRAVIPTPGSAELTREAQTSVWPPRHYASQVARLKRMVGRPVYIVEVTFSGLAIGTVFQSELRVLLDVVDFPRPDPSNALYPHMLVLDDGRVARVTINRAFDPKRSDVLYHDSALTRQLLYGPRSLGPRRIADIAREQLRRLLGRPAARLIGRDGNES